MPDEPDGVEVIRGLDQALLAQARRWRACVAAEIDAGAAGEPDWTEEFCLLVSNRLARLRKQGLDVPVGRSRNQITCPSCGRPARRRPA